MNGKLFFASVLVLTLLGACAAGDGPGRAARPVCLNDYDIRSFNPIDAEFLYVEGRAKSHYLFTLQRGCPGVRSASVIGIWDEPGRICANSMDEVLYREFGQGPSSCRILDIEQVSSREEARALARARIEARRER